MARRIETTLPGFTSAASDRCAGGVISRKTLFRYTSPRGKLETMTITFNWPVKEANNVGYDYCFVCGDKNPHGLHIQFQPDGDSVYSTFLCEERHIGWPNVQHGGITSSLLDEASAYVPLNMGLVTVTAELNISFKAPVRVGETVRLEAHPTKVTSRLLLVEASMVSETGEVKATSRAKMLVLSKEQQGQMGIETPPEVSS